MYSFVLLLDCDMRGILQYAFTHESCMFVCFAFQPYYVLVVVGIVFCVFRQLLISRSLVAS